MTNHSTKTTAILIPCRNEETTIVKVISGFQSAVPDAKIYVYDNASTDRTAQLAFEAGAEVVHETTPGKTLYKVLHHIERLDYTLALICNS